MTTIVTGNLGYVGPGVVQRLRSSGGRTIIGLDNGYFEENLLAPAALPDSPPDEQIIADVRDVSPSVLAGADSIVHLAGISNDPIGNEFAAITDEINRGATFRLAEMARRAGVRSFVFASSCSVYGCAEDGARSEASETGPLTPYAKSKVAAEEALRELAGRDFIVTCLRFATACGISPRLRLDLVLNDFVATAVRTGEIRILSDGTPWRPLIDVRDMARAIEWAVNRPAKVGGDFLVVNTGSDEWNYQMRDLAAMVAAVMPGTSISINKEARPDKRSYKVSFELFRRLAPEHQPAVSLRQSIEALRAGLEASGAAASSFAPSRFVRLHTLTELREQGRLLPDLRWTELVPASPTRFDNRFASPPA
ncbi:MAG TPA: SDR family oxidoreductase [Bryobacteraceae bacterium]|jgi:nucleoside-diphosphate-sugar epimerase|nr:SDR family oxidoreductase [Bryobacteraceae bacterium]